MSQKEGRVMDLLRPRHFKKGGSPSERALTKGIITVKREFLKEPRKGASVLCKKYPTEKGSPEGKDAKRGGDNLCPTQEGG